MSSSAPLLSRDSRRSMFGLPDKFSFVSPLWDMVQLFYAIKHKEEQSNRLGANLY
jgi:hypothetical protein